MDALGMIETKGLLAAIESADAMLKAAEVRLLERDFVGGGLVTVMVKGDVAAVKASIDAAAAAVNRIDPSLLISQHVIPRPHEELGENVISTVPLCERNEEVDEEEVVEEVIEEVIEEVTEEASEVIAEDVAQMHKADMDAIVAEKGLDKALEIIDGCKVVKLRNLAREYEDFGISGRVISKANKTTLLDEFKKYYTK